MTVHDTAPAQSLRRMIYGYRVTFLLRAAADLNIADLLRDGPRHLEELAARANCEPGAFRRVLFALAQLGVLVRRPGELYALTPLGECLRSDHPEKLNALARYQGHDFIQRPWSGLTRSARTGEPAFECAFGRKPFDYMATNPDIASLFTAGMAAHTTEFLDPIVSGYDWTRFASIVDLGGADGVLVAAILAAAPGASGVIFDEARLQAAAERQIRAAQLEDRCRFEAGDFFTVVPPGAGAYTLKYVLHDWTDEECVEILANIRRLSRPETRLLVIERLIPEDDGPALDTAMLDIAMLVITGGRERTASEFAMLYERAGFNLTRIIRTASPFSLIEGAPV